MTMKYWFYLKNIFFRPAKASMALCQEKRL